jgi:hypothetical protein
LSPHFFGDVTLSERKSKTYRIPEDLCKRIEEEVERRKQTNPNFSENDWQIEAAEHYLQCDKELQGSWRLIPLKFSGKCILHPNETIEAGHWAFYAKGIGVICPDGFIEKFGAKTEIKMLLKKRHLERTISFLEQKLNELAGKVEKHEEHETVEKIYTMVSEFHKISMEYYRRGLGTPDENKIVSQIISLSQKIYDALEDWRAYILGKSKKKKQTTEAYQS